MVRYVGRVRRGKIVALVALLAALGSFAAISAARGGSRSGSSTANASRSPSGTGGGASTRAACGPQHASTLAASGKARVYSAGAVVYGCANGSRQRFRLGKRSRCSVDPVTVAGVLVAYGLEKCGTPNCASKVLVRRLSDGKVLDALPAFKGPAGTGVSPTVVDSLVVKPDGAVAWIASGCSIDSPPSDLQVFRAVNRQASLLDMGKMIGARSLRLHGAIMSWRHSASARSAHLG